jgi:hypothetical protein
MSRSKLPAFVTGLILVFSPTLSVAMGPVAGGSTYSDPATLAMPASFWGRPYPYGYTGWGPCVRYVPVQTAWGTSWQRVSLCGYRRQRAESYPDQNR